MFIQALVIWLSCIASWTGANEVDLSDVRQKVLFMTNVERGLANVVLATAHAMLIDYPEVDVHLVSFPLLEKTTHEVSDSALQQSSAARRIKFENISAPSYGDVLRAEGFNTERTMNSPGLLGFSKFTANLEKFLCPWSGPEYVQIYRSLTEKIQRIDPDVIVLDTMLTPGVDATRDLDRKHVMLSANQLKDHFAQNQPFGAMFWKIPACVLPKADYIGGTDTLTG